MHLYRFPRWTMPTLILSLSTVTINSALAAQFPLRVRPVLIHYRIINSSEDYVRERPIEYIHPKLKMGETRAKRKPT